MFYLTTHSTHFIYGYMASDIWLRTILIVRKETRCRHIGYSYRLAAKDLLYAPSHRQDNTYHGLCYTSRGALAGTRNSSIMSADTRGKQTAVRARLTQAQKKNEVKVDMSSCSRKSICYANYPLIIDENRPDLSGLPDFLFDIFFFLDMATVTLVVP